MNPLLEQFLQEARENLAFIDQHIDQIDSGDDELLNSVFRAAHTLKGGSGIVGFESVKVITHHAEDLLDQLRSKKLDYSKDIEEALYDAFDEVVNLIEAAEESEDIVEADSGRTEKIINTLNALMGKDSAEEAWESPLHMAPDTLSLVNENLTFISDFPHTIPFQAELITEENINEKRLYGVLFDVDENCMVFGNDPLYALSLLGDSVYGINTCLNSTSIRLILESEDEDDLLVARTTVIAYIYASYDEIEEALFNFLDDLLFKPLDVVSLLNITRGEIATLDVIKDFAKHGAKNFLEGEMGALSASIDETLTLIGADTLQSRRLNRLKDLIRHIPEPMYEKMVGFFEVLNSSEVFTLDSASEEIVQEEVVAIEPVQEEKETVAHVEEEISEPKVAVDFGKEDHEVLFSMLKQQLVQLRNFASDDSVKSRVENFIMRPLQQMGYAFSSGHSSAESLIETIEAIMSGTDASPKESVTQVVVETASVAVEKTSIAIEKEIPEETVVEDVPAKASVVKKVPTKPTQDPKKNVIGKTVKIDQESIDHLMNIVGELLVAKNSLPYLADNAVNMDTETIKRSILEKYSFINRLSMQLQDLIMGMRMLPISYVFDRYPKLVRDISKTLGKKVNLTMDGGETKLDKNMIEMLADPMIHIMRNSLDHGVELPEARVEVGKTAEGNVKLNAFAQSDKIIITIEDDGAGINVERVINKVLEKGLLSLDAIEKMSDNEKAELVLLPGLSTADSITEFSGRGVGMDVVKKSIESFGGNISIRTESGKGTTISLAIPVSLAVTSLLHVSLGGVHYGFPMESVSETVKIEQKDIAILHNEPFVYLRGDVIPLLYIKQMLDFEAIGDGPLSLVVLNIKGNLLAVVVNELLGQLDVVQKPLEGVIDEHPIFSGTALLGNGQIIMVIDQDGLLSMSHTLKEDVDEAS